MAVCTHCATPLPDGSRFCSHCGTPAPGQEAEGDSLSPQSREIFDRLKEAAEGRYDILREIGRGGMAIVFLAYQKSLDRQVAIKVLLPFLGFDPGLVQRFLREARTQGRLDHPSIIRVYEFYDEGGLTFFTMPYVSGRSLRALLEQEARPPLDRTLRYLCQAADALSYAHRQGVIHRDVKPDNMVLDEERDSVILTDFGIAKALSAQTSLTTPGDLLGTPHYMSPEQGEGKLDLDGRADQYSLGLVGYEMMAGKRPFDATTLAELMYKHRFEDPENLETLRPDLPLTLRVTITRAIAKEREDRFPTMDAFLVALQSCTEIAGGDEERTEPMPPFGSGDTTVRVTTPPRRTPAPPQPPAGEGKPGAFYPDWLAAAPAEAGSGSPAASGAAAPRTAAGKGRGVPRALLIGGGLAVAAAVVGLFVLGPLRPVRDAGRIADSGPLSGAEPPSEQDEPLGVTETAPVDDVSAAGEESAAGADARTEEPVGATADVAGDTETEERPTTGGRVADETDATVATVDAEVQAAAVRAEGETTGARRGAVEAGAAAIFGGELVELDDRLDEADRMMAAGLYDLAISRYSDLAGDYGELAQRSANARENGGLEAAAARSEMEQQRKLAVDAGARQRAPVALMRAGVIASQARERFEAGDYPEATSLYRRARQAYVELQSGLTTAEEPAVSAEGAISAMVDRFSELFEQEDLRVMGIELYRAQVPKQDREFLAAVFDRAEEIQVVRLERSLNVEGTSATADVRLRMRFRQSRTGTRGERDLRLEMSFASTPGGWQLQRVRPRR